jgi:predicted RNA binding protein YcfA (HicA-like mRNA interferase family)
LSGEKIVSALERLGFNQSRQRGSHVVLTKQTPGGKRIAVVPLHKEVKIGTLQGILRQAGVTSEEFLKVL